MYEQQATLAEAAADTRTASRLQDKKLPLTLAPPRAHSTNQPTHWATACALASNSVVHVQRHLCAWQAQACVTVRHVRVRAAGGAGAAVQAQLTRQAAGTCSLQCSPARLQPSLLKVSEIPSPSLQDTRPGSWYRKYKCIKVFFCFTMLTVEVMPTPSVYFDFLILPFWLHIHRKWDTMSSSTVDGVVLILT